MFKPELLSDVYKRQEQDTGVLMGGIQADQSISFQAMRGKLQDFMPVSYTHLDVYKRQKGARS